MRHWPRYVGASLFAAAVGLPLWHTFDAHKRRQREAYYQSQLRRYTELFPVGTSRKAVDETLKQAGISTTSVMKVDDEVVYTELVEIGEERAPWYCSQSTVYVAVLFRPVGRQPSEFGDEDGTDEVTNVRIFGMLEGCL